MKTYTDQELIESYAACMKTVPFKDLAERSQFIAPKVATSQMHRCEDLAIRQEITQRIEANRKDAA